MTRDPLPLLEWSVDFTLVLLLASIILTFVRVVRGPSLPDRIIALDLIGILSVGFTALLAVRIAQPAFLDVAIALALIAFLGTVAYARFVEQRGSEARAPGEKDDR